MHRLDVKVYTQIPVSYFLGTPINILCRLVLYYFFKNLNSIVNYYIIKIILNESCKENHQFDVFHDFLKSFRDINYVLGNYYLIDVLYE